MPNASEILSQLNETERKALSWLPREGFVVGGFRAMGRNEPSQRAQKHLRALGLLVEHWTWASTTRPDTGLSELGHKVRNLMERVV